MKINKTASNMKAISLKLRLDLRSGNPMTIRVKILPPDSKSYAAVIALSLSI